MSHRTRKLMAIAMIALLIGGFMPSGKESLAASSFAFTMVRAAAVASCLPAAAGSVTITSVGPVEVMDVSISGLPPDTDFDLFVTQLPTAPFGVSWYQGDVETDRGGHGSQRFIGRFSLETFAVATGSGAAPVVHNGPFPDASTNPAFSPIHTFHLGLWFNSPADAQKAGCPNTVTPFNGDHSAGLQVLNTSNFTNAQGPLRQVDISTPGATPIDTFNSVSQTFKFDITRSTGIVTANCLPNAIGHVTIRAVGPVEVMDLAVSGLRPNTDFDFFVTQLPNAPFGEAWYQGDLETGPDGTGSQRYVGRFNIESFFVAPGTGAAPVVHSGPFPDASTNPQFSPVHTFHVGLWFNSPTDAQAVGCPATVTPFNGDHGAGTQVLSSRGFPDTRGPLACLPRPNVKLQTSKIGPGQLRGTLTASQIITLSDNFLTQIQVTRLDNTTLLVNGTPATAGQTVTLPAGTASAQVIVTRIAHGAFTARLAVTDDCGSWSTFLGGGAAVT